MRESELVALRGKLWREESTTTEEIELIRWELDTARELEEVKMSGGSFDYLFVKDVGEILSRTDLLEAMLKEIDEVDRFSRAHDTVEHIIMTIGELDKLFIGEGKGSLRNLMRSIEWHCSGDYGKDAVEKAIREYEEVSAVQ